MAIFLGCALLPIVLMSIFSYNQVVENLARQGEAGLKQQTKAVAMSIVERLLFLEASLEMVAHTLRDNRAEAIELGGHQERLLGDRFEAISIAGHNRETFVSRWSTGRFRPPPALTAAGRSHLELGRSWIVPGGGPSHEIWLVRAIDSEDLTRGLVWGQVNSEYLWGTGVDSWLPRQTELCVVNQHGEFLIRSSMVPDSLGKFLQNRSLESSSESIRWREMETSYAGAFWSIPMKTNYSVGPWTVALGRAERIAFEPLIRFRQNFILVALLSILAVLLISISQIRRSLVPLESLRQATRLVAERDFSSKVELSTGDEFEELASSFNAMARQLGDQFETLSTMAAVGREVLAGKRLQDLVESYLHGLSRIQPFDEAAIVLRDPIEEDRLSSFLWRRSVEDGEMNFVGSRSDSLGPAKSISGIRPLLARSDFRSVRETPLVVENRNFGAVTIACREGELWNREPKLLTELTEHLALALHHRQLNDILAAERQRLSLLIEHLPCGVFVLDSAHRITIINRLARSDLRTLCDAGDGDRIDLIGGRSLAELESSPREVVWRQIETETSPPRFFAAAAASSPKELTGSSWVVVLRDTTREHHLEKQLERQERLASIGQLAAGIAHDLNNKLQGIVLAAQAITADASEVVIEPELRVIRESSRRASSLIRQVLDFSRQSPMRRSCISLKKSVEESIRLLRRVVPENIKVVVRYEAAAADLWVDADPTGINQVVTNLVVNARDAMADGGELKISLSSVDLASTDPGTHMVPAGHWLVLSIADTGTGMTSEVQGHALEPFFSTKGPGKGTGLGLPQVYGIVKQHGGHLAFSSEEGLGSTFYVYFPRSKQSPQREVHEPSAALLPLGGNERILVVEDEKEVRRVVAKSLSKLGYEVVVAESGRTALDALSSLDTGVDLVLSDVVMPDMGGIELITRLRVDYPELSVVMMSGYSRHSHQEEIGGIEIQGWLEKPFEIESLARAVRKALRPTRVGVE